LAQHLFATILVDQVPILLYQVVALGELAFAVLADHVLLEFVELARGNVDHLLLWTHRIGAGNAHLLLGSETLAAIWLLSRLFFVLVLLLTRLLAVGPHHRSARHTFLFVSWVYKATGKLHVHVVEEGFVLPILRLVLVEVHFVELFVQSLLLGLLLLFGLLLFLCFLAGLDSFELIKYVLVVEDGMRKLVFEVIFVKQRVDAVLDDRVLQDLVDVWPLVRVHVQHGSQHVSDSLAEMSRDVGVLASDDLSSQLV